MWEGVKNLRHRKQLTRQCHLFNQYWTLHFLQGVERSSYITMSRFPSGKGKGAYTWYSASSLWITTAEALMYGTHFFTVLPAHTHVHPQSEWAIPAFAFPAVAGIIYRSRRDGRLSRPWCELAQAEIRTSNLPIANPALYHTASSASVVD